MRGLIAVFAGGWLFASPAFTQEMDTAAFRQTLDAIQMAAAGICGEYVREGRQWTTELDGAARAELEGLAGRLFELGVQGSGSLTDSEFSNVLQEQLAGELKDVRTCRQSVFDQLVAKTLPGTVQYEEIDNGDQEGGSQMGAMQPPVVRDDFLFPLFVGETVAINDLRTLLTLSEIESNGNFARFVIAKRDVQKSYNVRESHGNIFAIPNSKCSVMLYSVDYNASMVQLMSYCA